MTTVTLKDVQQAIIDVVNNTPCIKTTQLVVELDKDIITSDYDIYDVLSDLVDANELVCVKYILKDMPYREKWCIFPKGTVINF